MSEVWKRYFVLAEECGIHIPASFHSRRTSFSDKLQSFIEDIFLVVPASHNGSAERQTLLVHVKLQFTSMLQVIDDYDDEDDFSVYDQI